MENDVGVEEDVPMKNLSEDCLLTTEKWWRDHYYMLEAHGYRLRPRYHPDWIPSWKISGKCLLFCEDSIFNKLDFVIDATRISDGTTVAIKRVGIRSREISIALYLSPGDEDTDSSMNHCVPVLDHFSDPALPQYSFLVMPHLRWYDDPPFSFVDEVIDFIHQSLEGLVHMHSQGVAHRDLAELNIMIDASSLYPRGYHPVAKLMDPSGLKGAPVRRRRDVRGVKYYFVDFGISSRFEPGVKLHDRLVLGRDGQDRDVPELSNFLSYDPFAVDIFTLANVYRKTFLDVYANLEFLSPLVDSMMERYPHMRPSAESALSQFRAIITEQSGMLLRWRVVGKDEGKLFRFLHDLPPAFREMAYVAKKRLGKTLLVC